MTSAGYSGPRVVKYLFIDGGCLHSLLKVLSEKYFSSVPIELDFQKFTSEFTKVFYYDALPVKKGSESEDQFNRNFQTTKKFIEDLEMLDRFHVYLGESKHGKKGIEQKQVDVLIAIHLLKHSFNRNMHRATLLTTDSDFIPLLDALVETGMHITIWYGDSNGCRANKGLLKAADSRRKIGIKGIYECTKEEFSKKYKIPKVTSGPKKEYTTLIQALEDESFGKIELYKEDDFIIVFRDKRVLNIDFLSHISFPDLEILRFFAEDEYKIIIP